MLLQEFIYLILFSQDFEVENFVREYTHTFSSEEYDWGFSKMISWDKFLDFARGYVKNDKIILQVIIQPQCTKVQM